MAALLVSTNILNLVLAACWTIAHPQADAIVINTCGFVEDAKDESIEVGGWVGAPVLYSTALYCNAQYCISLPCQQ